VAAAGPEISATARLPDRIVAALVEADLFRLATPLAYGGVQCDLATFATISQVIGRADMSAAWCIVQGNASVHSLAPRLDPDAGREPSANLVP
jgi:alkylation response protein AidB-like acyl-CoA dehydrogenase